MPAIGCSINRRFSIFSDLSKKIRGEAERYLLFLMPIVIVDEMLLVQSSCLHFRSNPEFQKTVKELKEKAEELKGVKEDLKVK